MFNKKKSNSSSGVCGVYWYSQKQKWSAEIVISGQKIFLGLFDNLNEAIKIRREAELKYFGNFAYQKEGDDCVCNGN